MLQIIPYSKPMVSLLLCCNSLLNKQKHSKWIANTNQKGYILNIPNTKAMSLLAAPQGVFAFMVHTNSSFIMNMQNANTLQTTPGILVYAVHYVCLSKVPIPSLKSESSMCILQNHCFDCLPFLMEPNTLIFPENCDTGCNLLVQ